MKTERRGAVRADGHLVRVDGLELRGSAIVAYKASVGCLAHFEGDGAVSIRTGVALGPVHVRFARLGARPGEPGASVEDAVELPVSVVGGRVRAAARVGVDAADGDYVLRISSIGADRDVDRASASPGQSVELALWPDSGFSDPRTLRCGSAQGARAALAAVRLAERRESYGARGGWTPRLGR